MKMKEDSEEAGLKLNIQKNEDHGIWSHHFMANRWGNNESCEVLFSWAPKITADGDCSHGIKRRLLLGRKSMRKPRQHIKKQRHYFADKGPSSWSYGFSSSHVWMWELDHKECWVLKNWCFWTVVWRRLLRVPWTARRSNLSILNEINPKYSLEGLMLKMKLQYFGHLMWKADLLEKTLVSGKDWRREEKGMKEDEMAGWHHWLNGHEFEQALGDGEGQERVACCSPRCWKEMDTTGPLNNEWMAGSFQLFWENGGDF